MKNLLTKEQKQQHRDQMGRDIKKVLIFFLVLLGVIAVGVWLVAGGSKFVAEGFSLLSGLVARVWYRLTNWTVKELLGNICFVLFLILLRLGRIQAAIERNQEKK
jgi:hypothetical protein